MSTLFQDLRLGLRMALRTPVVTGVAALSLALGIAANASMFAILNAFLFEPLPYGDQEGLAVFREAREGDPMEMSPGISPANFRDYTSTSGSLESTTFYTAELVNLTGFDTPEELQVVIATPELFDVLRVQPFLGRGFRPEEGVEGSGDVVVLHHSYWETRFGGDPGALGRTMMLDGVAYTVIGVMPEAFDMIPADIQAIRPSDFEAQMEARGGRGFIGYGRLLPGRTPAQVEAELRTTYAGLATEFPDANRGWELRVIPLGEFFPGETDRKLILLLTAVTLFGLLIACANVANLLLSRAESRQKEIALRKALGAGRGRVLRQLLTESVLLGLVAGGVGVVLSIWIIQWLAGVIPPQMPRTFIPRLDLGVLMATLGVSVLAGILFGVAPAMHASGGDLREALSEGSRGGTAGRRRRRLRNAFVVGEFAVALALLTGAGIMIQAFDGISSADPGFDPDGLLTFRLAVLENQYPEAADVAAFHEEMVRTLGAVPGVQGVAIMSQLPRSQGYPRARYTVDGRPEVDPAERPLAGYQRVNPDYFSTMDVPLLQGRVFGVEDRADAPLVAVVNQAFVDREFAGEDPVGRLLNVAEESRTIVGVVANVMQERIPLAGSLGEAIYLPLAQVPHPAPRYAVRTSGDPGAIAADVRAAVWSVEPDQPIAELRSMQDHIDENMASAKALSTFLSAMAALALALAAMGIYGVMAHSVAQQRRDIGIRMALGADRGTVVAMVTKSGAWLAGVGMALGIPIAFLIFRGISSAMNLFEGDLGISYALAVSGVLAAVALIATYLPARRASAVPPVVALRD
jgi:putative ABC transport system permease protein